MTNVKKYVEPKQQNFIGAYKVLNTIFCLFI